MTAPEIALWQALRIRPGGLKFRRQHPVGPYIADFCCLSSRLVVEIDGFVHETGKRPEADLRRDNFIIANGFKVVRVTSRDVLRDLDGVVSAIVALAASPLHRPADGPPPRAGEDC